MEPEPIEVPPLSPRARQGVRAGRVRQCRVERRVEARDVWRIRQRLSGSGERGQRPVLMQRCQRDERGDRCFHLGGHERRLSETGPAVRSEEHTSELQSLMRISYAVFCLKKKK